MTARTSNRNTNDSNSFINDPNGQVARNTVSHLVDQNGDSIVNSNGQLKVVLDGRVDSNNSTTTPLAGDAVYTGTAVETLDYSMIFITIYADQASATDGLEVQMSHDGTTWRESQGDVFTIAANTEKTFSFQTHNRYYRVKYTNGSTPQTEFTLTSILKKTNSKASSHRISDAISPEDDATLQKSVLTGQNPAGNFINFEATNGGNFKVSLEELESGVSVNNNSQLKTTLYTELGNRVFSEASFDSFERLRVSQAVDLINNKNIFDVDGIIFKEKLVGSGTVTYTTNESTQYLNVTNADGDRVVRQSPHVPYIPSKSQLILATGVIGIDTKANSVRRIGYFDDRNGLFFEMNGTTMYAVRRTYTSGSVVDNAVAQTSWNIDAMDGNGPSGITADWTKTHIFGITFQWLGVGRVVMFLDIDGMIYPVHQFTHANILAVPYTANPSLPIRYEILNDGATSGNSELHEICSSVSSEGAFGITGRGYARESGYINVGTTKTPVLAIRLKNTFTSKPNRVACELTGVKYFSEDQTCQFFIEKIANPTTVTATWTSNGTYSAIEYATAANITTITGTALQLSSTIVPANTQGQTTSPSTGETGVSALNESRSIHQSIDSDNSDIFVIYAQARTSTTDIQAIAEWLEII